MQSRSYFLPLIQDIFDQLGEARIFLTLDLKNRNWQIPETPNDRHKTVFTCHRELFEFKRLPFGLANALAILQRVLICVCCFNLH